MDIQIGTDKGDWEEARRHGLLITLCCLVTWSLHQEYKESLQSLGRAGPCGVIEEQTKDNDRVPSGAHNPPQLVPSWAFLSNRAPLSLLHSQLKGAQFVRFPSPHNSPPYSVLHPCTQVSVFI